MNILLFSGSLQINSLNKKLLAVANHILVSHKHKTTVADLKSLAFPVYDGDIEAAGIPEGVKQLGQMIAQADALVIASPEYNGAMAGSLKNAVDWVSRIRPMPLGKKPVLLMGASPGGFGAIRALGNSRAPFETLGCFVYPQTFALPKADQAFSPTGEFGDEKTKQHLADLLVNYTDFAEKFLSES